MLFRGDIRIPSGAVVKIPIELTKTVIKERDTLANNNSIELEKLAHTLEWVNDTSVEDWADVIRRIGGHPFLTVGSGGSLAGAAYWSKVHELMTGQPSKYGTPLDLVAQPSVSPYAVGLLSAGGGNPDIVHSLTHAACDSSPGQFILTFAEASPLNTEAERHGTAPFDQLRLTDSKGRIPSHQISSGIHGSHHSRILRGIWN